MFNRRVIERKKKVLYNSKVLIYPDSFHSGGIAMIRCTFFAGITALLITLMSGCGGGGSSTDNPIDISDDTLYEVRIGGEVLDPIEPNIVPLSKVNTIQFQFLKKFHPFTFQNSVRVLVELADVSHCWAYDFTEADITNNGLVSFRNNEWGSVVTYTSNQPFASMIKSGGLTGNHVYPGDKLNIDVGFLRAQYDDTTQVVLKKDKIALYCSRDVYERPVSVDDMNSDGFIQSIKLGDYLITDKKINIIPLDQVYEINVDFNTQLNPYTFKDLLDFRIIINNYYDNTSYIIERSNLEENGDVFIVDYVYGKVKLRLKYGPISHLILNGVEQTPSQPGDLIEVSIDFFSGEDIFENEFKFENKKFRIFHSSI